MMINPLLPTSVTPPGDQKKSIWIDIDNSPHVPFFIPFIEEIQKRGYRVLLTARNSYQVAELLEFHHLECKVIGGHWGKNRLLKILATFFRAVRLLPLSFREKPDLAISIVSRAQILACKARGIPIVVIFDYEFIAKMQFLRLDWIFVPEAVPDSDAGFAKQGIWHYPGLKEDVYVPRFQPNAGLREELGISETELLATVRPPAIEAHYHNSESDLLLNAALQLLIGHSDVRVVLLPRNQRQSVALRKQWAESIEKGKIVIPARVVDGLNLIWQSDLVISGGGTMNREASALGVPVYSIFRGKIGAVDRYLARTGRLVLLERVEDVRTKIVLQRREKLHCDFVAGRDTLARIVEAIVSILEGRDESNFPPL